MKIKFHYVTRIAVGLWVCTFLLAPLHSATAQTAAPPATPAVAQITDRLIVRYRENATELTANLTGSAKTAKLTALLGTPIQYLRPMSGGRTDVYRFAAKRTATEVEQYARTLSNHPDIEYAHPDRISFTQLVPTDPQYPNQWALGNGVAGLNLAGAWDITTGDPNLVIGLLDSGLLPHNDLDQTRILPGYDFVQVNRSNDGSGLDNNSTDSGDWVSATEAAPGGTLEGCPVKDSSWHGTAMAGAIMAIPNNGSGITGINWQSKLLPVRVAGKCGAYASDIIDGMRWAAGIPVNGNTNPNPAKVINLSLATQGQCDTAYQSAINEVTNLGTTLIVAAGNSAQNTGLYSPASCNNVIVVGAVGVNGGLPSYANSGTEVTISAPGGDAIDGILTLSDSGTTTPISDNLVKQVQGTSIATANVTGVVSLMLSANAKLKPTDVKSLLKAGSQPFPSPIGEMLCTAMTCGSGILDANLLVKAAQPFKSASPSVWLSPSLSWGVLRNDGTLWVRGNWQDSAIVEANGVAAGTGHKLVLKSDGTVWGSGGNNNGQLGNGTTTYSQNYVQAVGLSGIKAIVAGATHSMALKADGTVWAWGKNASGQLGDGTTQDRLAPIQVSGMSGVVMLAAGHRGSLALKSDGTVWAWGDNAPNVNFLSAEQTLTYATPKQVAGLSGVVAIAAGDTHFLALKSDGTVWAWGCDFYGKPFNGATYSGTNNSYGQLGDGTTTMRSMPVQVTGLTDVVMLAGGNDQSLALKSDGTVWAWGRNDRGLLGDGTKVNRQTPVRLEGLSNIVFIAAAPSSLDTYSGYVSDASSLAVRIDGALFKWGYEASWVSDGTNVTERKIDITRPQLIPDANVGAFDAANFSPKVEVARNAVVESVSWQTAGIANSGTISVAGGEYRVDNNPYTSSPGTINPGQAVTVRVTTANGYNQPTTAILTVGGVQRHFTATTLALDTTPEAFVFTPQAGVSANSWVISNAVTVNGINGPVPISIVGGQYQVNNGGFTSLAGTVNAGDTVSVREMSGAANQATQAVLTVGDANATFNVISAPPAGFTTKPMVAANGGDTNTTNGLILKSDGTVWLGGAQVAGLSGVVAVAAGSWHYLALRSDGTVWAWGWNAFGQVADGTMTDRAMPLKVSGLSGIAAVSAGGAHSLALGQDGTVWAWGSNDKGQLGDGTTTGRLTAVQLNNVSNVVAIAAGYSHSLAVKSDGTVWGWGDNSVGAVGDGTWHNRSTPVLVPQLADVKAVAAGRWLSLALRTDGTVWAWGDHYVATLVDNGMAVQSFPVQMAGLNGVTAISAGRHAMALQSDGTVWAWGKNDNSQLGDGTTADRWIPVQVAGLSSITTVDAGITSYTTTGWDISGSMAIRQDGTLFQWGKPSGNNFPQVIVNFNVGTFDAANFSPKVEVARNAVVESVSWQTAGIANSGTISVAGGEYRVDNNPYTSSPGTINPGQAVTVRVTTANGYNQPTTAILTVGGVQRHFTATTLALDTTPEAFVFTPQAGVSANSWVVSNAVTMNGINGPAPISIVGGLYQVNNGGFTSSAGTVNAGDTVSVRGMSGAANQATQAVLTVGDANATFNVISAPQPGFVTKPMVTGSTNGLTDANQILLKDDGSVWMGGAQVAGLSGVVAVAAGSMHYLALRADGTVWGWGASSGYRLGSGTQASSAIPIQVIGLSGVTRISAGYDHSLALKADGTVWAWGGEYGYGATPVQIVGLNGVVGVATGFYLSVAVKSDGTVWAWGSNDFGQLGDGSNAWRSVPVQVAGLQGITAVAAGDHFGLALGSGGIVWAWGSNVSGQLGDGTTANRNIPVQVAGLTGAIAIVAGYNISMALKDDGAVWAWGAGNTGELGNELIGGGYRAIPGQVTGLSNISMIGAGLHSQQLMAIRADGGVFQWGMGTSLPTSLPLNALRPDFTPESFSILPLLGQARNSWVVASPVTVRGMTATTPIGILGGEYSVNSGVFTSQAGTIQSGDVVVVRVMSGGTYGTTTSATLTVGTYTTKFQVATQDDPNAATVDVTAAGGDAYSVILRPDGGVFTFGYNGNGQLGDGGYMSRSTPGSAAGVGGIKKIAAGKYHALAVKKDGSLQAWGWNAAGQLGTGSSENARREAVTIGLTNVKDVAAGYAHSIALKSDGTVWAWGHNADGQLGDGQGGPDGAVPYRNTPYQVPGLTSIVAIAAGERHSIAVDLNGNVFVWGANDGGQLGTGTNDPRTLSPTRIMLSGATAVAAGAKFTLALRNDGSLWAWGGNSNGQLGDGTRNGRSLPSVVPSLRSGVTKIAAGDKHSLAIANGSVYAWGWNQNGQLGDGATTDRLNPIIVPNSSGAASVAAGARHSLVLFADNSILLWGDNTYGQLGNRSGNYDPAALAQDQLRGDGQVVIVVPSNRTSIGTVNASSGSNSLTVNTASDCIAFGVQAVGVSNQRSFQLANTYLSTWSSLSIQTTGGGFTQTNDCPGTLNAGSRCTLNAIFTPPNPAEATGSITIQGNRGNGLETIKTISLNGIGSQANTPRIQFTATALDFGVIPQGAPATAQRITLTNAGTGNLTIGAINLTGADYSQSNTCQNTTLAPSTTCAIDIGFTPGQTNTRTGNLTIAHNATGNSTSINLTGQGQDTTPDTFTLTSQTADLGQTVNKSFVVSGINAQTTISITGGQYSLDGIIFTSSSGNVQNGQTVYVKATAPGTYGSTAQTTVTVGGVTGSFSVSTQNVSDGACGSSNASTLTATPTGGLCATGTASTVNGTGPWNWSCAGANGGTSATCSAALQTTSVPVHMVIGWNLLGNSINAPLDVAATLGDAKQVTTVWKWVPATSRWAFYAPSMTAPNLATYAAGKGYDVLATINGGEGFWVNAKAAFSAQLPAGTAISSLNFVDQSLPPNNLSPGWSLIAIGDNNTPRAFATAISTTISTTTPGAGSVPTSLATLWAWDSTLSSWYFYAPSLDNSGGLAGYITSKGYLNFGAKTLDPTMGFWVNHP